MENELKNENEVKIENDERKTELEELKKSINTLKGKLTTLENKKKDIEKEADDLIASTIYQKKTELERSCDEIIKEAEQRLKVVEKEKVEERKKNIKNLIEHSTRNIKENNIYLANEIKRILKENNLPLIINSSVYMSLWNPTSASEMLGSMIGILAAIIIPTFLSFGVFRDLIFKTFTSGPLRVIIIVFIYFLSLFVIGLIWLLIDKATKKKPDVIAEIKELRKNIFDNKKEIEKVTKEVSEDTTDDKFDYTKLDREIEAGKIEVENYRNKKREALEKFVEVTQDEISKKVGDEARKEINAIDKEIENVKKELSNLQKKHDVLKIEIASV